MLAKWQRELGLELLLGYDPCRPIDDNDFFRKLALWCAPRNFCPYPFPTDRSGGLRGSARARALLVEQMWRHVNPDVVLVVEGDSAPLAGPTIPTGLSAIGHTRWGALLVDSEESCDNDPVGALRVEARLSQYDFLITPNIERFDRPPRSSRSRLPPTLHWPASEIESRERVRTVIDAIRAGTAHDVAPDGSNAGRRRRLAMFAPLRPEEDSRSTYYRSVLPVVARHFAIDVWNEDGSGASLTSDSPLAAQPTADFASLANSYDVIAYAFADCAACAPLIDYLQVFPGVAILHDESFDHLFAAVEEATSAADVRINEALFSGGTRARRALTGAKDGAAVPERLSLGRTLFELATGIVVFSPGHKAAMERTLGRRWPTPIAIARQVATNPPTARAAARRAMGIAESDFAVVFPPDAFGDTHGRELLTELAEQLPATVRPIALNMTCPATANPSVRRRVRFTGSLSHELHARYIAGADIAFYPGAGQAGWPEQCLGSGIPLLCTDEESASFFGGSPVSLLCCDPSPAEIARQLVALSAAGASDHDHAIAGRLDFVARHHSVRRAGETLANRLLTLGQLADAASPITFGQRLAGIGREEQMPDEEVAMIARSIMVTPTTPRLAPQRILVDVTNTSDREFVTGIERVVTEITTRICCLDRPGLSVEPVTMRNGQLFEPTPWLYRRDLLRPEELPSRTSGRLITPAAGDIMLMIDSSWNRLVDFASHYRQVQRGAGAVYTVIYDLLPIRLPECFSPGSQAWFSRWIERAIGLSDGLVCISKAVADDLIAYINEAKFPHKPSLRIGYWHLGSNFKARSVEAAPSDRSALAARNHPFIMVGTIEPRKRHALVLDALEDLWRRGGREELAIVGRPGWMVDALMERLRSHAELGKRLHLIEGATDDELAFLYGHCHALIQASDNEGFGLPIIEAAQYGKPVVLSDIPVFREIAGDNAAYFPPGSRSGLATVLKDSWDGKLTTDSRNISWLSWEQSVDQLASVILDHQWYRILD